MSNEAFWIGPCGHSWDIKLGAECPECHSRSLREFSHASVLRRVDYPEAAGSVTYGRGLLPYVAVGSRPADLDAALAEIERLIVELAAMKCNALELKATITERDDLARRLADAENEIAALRNAGAACCVANPYGDRLPFNANSQDKAPHQPPASQRQVANPAPAAGPVAVPDQARTAGAAVSDEMTLRLVRPVNWDALAGYPVGEALPVTTAANPAPAAGPVAVPDQAGAAGADEVLSDFWDYCSNDVAATLPIGVQRAWLVPQMDGIKAIVARQPADDLAIPPVPFNALRYSR